MIVEANYHVQWDLYGTFCIVPAVDDARAMLTALRISNQQWTVTVNEKIYDRPVRPLDVRPLPQASYSDEPSTGWTSTI